MCVSERGRPILTRPLIVVFGPLFIKLKLFNSAINGKKVIGHFCPEVIITGLFI
jgi:hypothetical protein